MRTREKALLRLLLKPLMILACIGALVLDAARATEAQVTPGPRSGVESLPQLETPEDLLRYMAAHRADTSLVVYTVRADGMPDERTSGIAFNATQPMPLGSTIKIVTLATYAREVGLGRLSPLEPVSVSDWERFYVPGRDALAHPAALAALGWESDDLGFAVNRSAALQVDALVGLMIRFSDNAAADWLLSRLGPERFRETIAQAELTHQEMPQSILGLFLSWINHEQPVLTWNIVRRLLTLGPTQYAAYVSMLESRYQRDDWRLAEWVWLLTNPSVQYDRQSILANNLFPKGAAIDYARIMAGVMTGTFLSPTVSDIMRHHLEWPMQIPALADGFDAYGNKGGSLPGVLTDANFFVAHTGDFAGRPRVAVLFLRNLPEAVATRLGQNALQHFFDRKVATDAAFAESVARTLRVRPRF